MGKQRYVQDESGQWWYQPPGGGTANKAWPDTCDGCGSEFLRSQGHKAQRFCSHSCAALARSQGRNADASFTGVVPGPLFRQDDDGQWWHYTRTQRARAKVRACAECGSDFLVPAGNFGGSYGRRFCSVKCARVRSPRWKGGRRVEKSSGYVVVWAPDHHSRRGTKSYYVREHRLVMEEKLGRELLPSERVHHLNGDRADNRPENLELWGIGHPSGQRAAEAKHCPTCTCGREEGG